ncbi:helix-turn-helix domain-containing protein [Pacificibacter marinus]|jgi:transcriptional regulator with XRE-family HTH domain|uniref:Helix-turn-helix domain protein n=1 Tax=Pacificibacter marinus TaxID=658057 RepID=A0A1Y5SWG9_9RHOB|nr:helix-turn-helix transcriptional regulator [Pacificibacter marinus]SEK86126.1 Helix-turn-helix [Pacificibacter marinus]SLN50094.1 Helix-turn-helix domain protein [Pacificibacter marinus]
MGFSGIAGQNDGDSVASSEPTYLRSVFGANLRELSQSAPSIAQLCRELGINRTQYNRYLSGDAFPRPDVLHKICTFFKVDGRILLEPLEKLKRDQTEREGQSPISEAVRRQKIAQVDETKLIPGPYLFYRRSFVGDGYITVNLVCLKSDARGSMGVTGILARSRSDELGLPIAGHERRIDGMFFQHPTGFSFLSMVRNLPLWNMGFVEFAYLGNSRFLHGVSIVTQRFTSKSSLYEPVLIEQIDPTMAAMLKARHILGHKHVDTLSATAQLFFKGEHK